MDDDTPSCAGSPWYIGQSGGAPAVLVADGTRDCPDDAVTVGAAVALAVRDADGAADVAGLTDPEQAAAARASRTSEAPPPSLAAPP
ncbi:MAG TPA: hypothetical protein VGG23_09105 [Acidimicrobiales bacterium]|jgi:hypothetical protein